MFLKACFLCFWVWAVSVRTGFKFGHFWRGSRMGLKFNYCEFQSLKFIIKCAHQDWIVGVHNGARWEISGHISKINDRTEIQFSGGFDFQDRVGQKKWEYHLDGRPCSLYLGSIGSIIHYYKTQHIYNCIMHRIYFWCALNCTTRIIIENLSILFLKRV